MQPYLGRIYADTQCRGCVELLVNRKLVSNKVLPICWLNFSRHLSRQVLRSRLLCLDFMLPQHGHESIMNKIMGQRHVNSFTSCFSREMTVSEWPLAAVAST